MKKMVVVLCVALWLSFSLMSCSNISNNNSFENNSSKGEQMIIEKNTEKLEPIFVSGKYYYDSHKTAKMFAEALLSINAGNIADVYINENQKYDDYVIIVTLTNVDGKKYCATLDANTGFVSVIYENDLDGKALYYMTDD